MAGRWRFDSLIPVSATFICRVWCLNGSVGIVSQVDKGKYWMPKVISRPSVIDMENKDRLMFANSGVEDRTGIWS